MTQKCVQEIAARARAATKNEDTVEKEPDLVKEKKIRMSEELDVEVTIDLRRKTGFSHQLWVGHTEVVELNPAVLHLQQRGTPTCGELGVPEFFGRRLQTSMTRATVEESTAGLRQTLRTGRLLVGGLSFHGVSGRFMNPWHKGRLVECKPRVYETRVSCSGGRLSTCDPHFLGWRSVLGTAKTRLKAHQNTRSARRDQQTRATLWHELFQDVARARARRRPP